MTTVKVNTEIDKNGRLRLDVPLGLPAGKAEVLIVVQQEAPTATESTTAVAGRARSGIFLGKPGGDIDVDAALEGMNHAWQSKLSDLK